MSALGQSLATAVSCRRGASRQARDARHTRGLLRVVLLLALVASAQAGRLEADHGSLAHAVPADVGFFVELRNGEQLLKTLTDPQLWSTLADIAGQPAGPADTAEWRTRIAQTVKMSPEEAIHVLLADRVAFIGEGLGQSQDALAICRPRAASIESLWNDWRPTPLPDEPTAAPAFSLPSKVSILRHNDLLLFGDAQMPRGLFRRVQKFIAEKQEKSLAADPTYRALLSRLPTRPDGVVFARLKPLGTPRRNAAAATQPTTRAADNTGAHRGKTVLDAILIGIKLDADRLRLTLVTEPPTSNSASTRGGVQFVPFLPASTLAAWEGAVDFAAAVERSRSDDDGQHGLRAALAVLEPRRLADQFLDVVEPATCVALGAVNASSRMDGDIAPAPAVACLISVGDPVEADRVAGEIVDAYAAVYNLAALTQDLEPLPAATRFELLGVPASSLDLSRFARALGLDSFEELHFCWAVHHDALIVATHVEWLRQVIAARIDETRQLANEVRQLAELRRAAPRTLLMARIDHVAEVCQQWLRYLEQHQPDTLNEGWWRGWQPGGGRARLGIDVVQDTRPRRLRVRRVETQGPAAGVLRVGDVLVGIEDRRFESETPIDEVHTALEARENARWVTLLVERDGVTRWMRVPLPFFNPVQMLRRIAALGTVADELVYYDGQTDTGEATGTLVVRLEPLQERARSAGIISEQPAVTERSAKATDEEAATEPATP